MSTGERTDYASKRLRGKRLSNGREYKLEDGDSRYHIFYLWTLYCCQYWKIICGQLCLLSICSKFFAFKTGFCCYSNPLALVQCHKYSGEPGANSKAQPFVLRANPIALLTMDFHAHLARSEVIGFLGGRWDPDDKGNSCGWLVVLFWFVLGTWCISASAFLIV